MPLCSVDVLVSEHFGDDIDVACLAIKFGAVSAAQLVRGDLFERRHDLRVFFDQKLDASHRHALFLERHEQRRHFVEFFVLCALVQPGEQSVRYFIRKIQDRLRAAFARDLESVDVEIEIVHVKSDQLADTDARAEKERHDRKIAQSRLFVERCLARTESFAAVHAVQEARDFVDLKAYDWLFVQFRRKHL